MADHFQQLLLQLNSLLSRPEENVEYALYQVLEAAKPRFLPLFDLPPRDQKEKSELEARTPRMSGIPYSRRT